MSIFYKLNYLKKKELYSQEDSLNTTEILTLNEIFSIQGMKSGQKDIYTFLKLKIENIDVKSIQEEILKEIEKI